MTAPVTTKAHSKAQSPATPGILLAIGGSIVMSMNDLAIKALSSTYALHQVILVRALIGICVVCALILYSGTGFRQLLTKRRGAHLFRVTIVMISNVTYFVGLSLMPIADAVATAFIAPMLVTMMSALLLGEDVGPRRWAAVVVGFAGVIVMTRPGAGTIQPAAILVLISAFCYAGSHMMTRRMRETESAATLSFFVQLGFICVSSTMGLVVGDGHLAQAPGSTWEFLFRPWMLPETHHLWAFVATGLSVSIGGLMVTHAYRTTDASLIAPFEYVGMPMAIFWGVVYFHTWPDHTAWAGIALICGAGLYTLWRETVRGKRDISVPAPPSEV